MSTRPPPLASVVIPTRDREIDVRQAVTSALAQTLSDIEVIVVDDGSARPMSETIGSLIADPRLTFHRNESATGPSAARNVGTALARGTVVAYLDSDDEWHPTKLERQIRALDHGPAGTGLSLCGYEVRDGTVRRARVPRAVRAGHEIELLDTRHEPTVTSCFVLPRAIALAYPFDAALSAYEDLDVATRIATEHDIVTTRMILVRKHVSADRQFAGPRVIDSRRAYLEKHAATLGRHPRVVGRNEIVIAAELARSGRTQETRATLAAIDRDNLSPWVRTALRLQPKLDPARLPKLLDGVRRIERFSAAGAVWRFRTSRLRWEP